MGYRGGSLESLASPLERGVRRFATRATGEVGDFMLKRVRRHSPIAKPGVASIRASYSSTGEWIRARGGRRPGTLLESWERGEVEVLWRMSGERRRVEVGSDDPVAYWMEHGTPAHFIEAKRADALTIPTPLGMVLRKRVHHPGTEALHMMAKAVQETAVEWRGIVAAEWAKEVRVIFRGFRS
jgi:hypothetical protein